MFSRVRTAVFVGVATILLGTGPAIAAPLDDEDKKAEAQSHFAAATRLYEVEDFAGAAAEFETSVRLFPTKNGWFNLANCYKALHRYHEAYLAVEALEAGFDDKLDKTMRRKKDELKSLIESIVGELTIYAEPSGVDVFLDGRAMDRKYLGVPIKVGPGEHRIEVRMNGFEPVLRKVSVNSQKTHTVRIALSSAKSTLSVSSDVNGATVLLDGWSMGQTPLGSFAVSPGEHTLEVFKDGYTKQVREIRSSAGERMEIEFSLTEASRHPAAAPKEKKNNKLIPTLKVAALSTTAVAAVLTGVFYGLAAWQASEFEKYDEEFKHAVGDAIRVAEANRADAESKTVLFTASGVAMAVTTGVFGVSTAVLFVLDKKRKKKTEAGRTSVQGGLVTVSF